MASGRTHARVAEAVIASGIVAAGVFYFQDPATLAISVPVCAGLVNGWIVTPDADVDHMTEEERRWRSVPVVGWLLAIVFSTFWYPYALLFSHRGLSHVFVIGTGTRFIYQFAGFFFWSITLQLWVAFLAGVLPEPKQLLVGIPVDVLLLYFAGWCIQDTGHLIFDMKLWRNLRRKSQRPFWIARSAVLVGIAVLVCYWLFF